MVMVFAAPRGLRPVVLHQIRPRVLIATKLHSRMTSTSALLHGDTFFLDNFALRQVRTRVSS